MIVLLTVALCATPIGVDFIDKSESYSIGGSEWTVERWSRPDSSDEVIVKRGGKTKLLVTANDFGGDLINVGRAWYPVGYPVIVVSGHTGCSHGQGTRFYAVHDGDMKEMLRIDGEVGGPIFRDFDDDGQNEWVFDNWNYWDANPSTKFLIYKQTGARVKFWKSVPNPNNVSLPSHDVRRF